LRAIELKPQPAIRGFEDVVVIPFQNGAEERAKWPVIINDEDVCHEGRSLPFPQRAKEI